MSEGSITSSRGALTGVEDERILIYIPISHTEEDMGNLRRYLPPTKASPQLSAARWNEIQHHVQMLGLDWSNVKVYQDGLPNAGSDIVQKILTEVQSPNYDLLRWLVAQGAEIIGTESPALMKEEYAHLRAVLMAENDSAKAIARRAYAARSGALLAERDSYIACRIAETLPPGGVSLLFIGQAHHVARYLPPDILVRKLPRNRTDEAT